MDEVFAKMMGDGLLLGSEDIIKLWHRLVEIVITSKHAIGIMDEIRGVSVLFIDWIQLA